MAEIKYLYGAAVQGIQSFIFQTNKLREIVGASELVYDICTTFFEEFATEGEEIQRAAGCIKHIFNNEDACRKAVLHFPKKVMEGAPGITVSQAVVRFKDTENDGDNPEDGVYPSFRKAVNELERRLRIQRNHPVCSLTCGLMGIKRSRTTGLPLVRQEGKVYFDIATDKMQGKSGKANQKLCFLNFGECEDKRLIFDIKQMTGQNDWVAIVHIDGNGLGQVVQAIGTQKDSFKNFSHELERVTIKSAYEAYATLESKYGFKNSIPMRPIVLSGDDHTLICQANLAIEYVQAFFKQFESQTKEQLGHILQGGHLPFDYLTTCAGIAYVKSSFPFHYGYRLAEELCSRAKADAKSEEHKIQELPCSCLMFHKVQDSFIEEYKDIVIRELTPWKNFSLEFGPYYYKDHLNETDKKRLEKRWSINDLAELSECFNKEDGNAIKSNLRQWLTLPHKRTADLKLERFKSLLDKEQGQQVDKMTSPVEGRIPAYDLLVLHTITNQRTKEVRDEKV